MVVCICPSDNRSHGIHRIVLYLIFLNEVIKCTFPPVMCMFYSRNVKRYCTQFFSLFQNLFKGHIVYFCFFINKPFDQPGTGKTVYFWSLPCNPFHAMNNYMSGTAIGNSDYLFLSA